MNMPFELGLDMGARLFGNKDHNSKKALVLEEKPYRYQIAMSDFAESDIEFHNSEPIKLIRDNRNWFIKSTDVDRPDSPAVIWYSFNDFMSDFYDKRLAGGFTDEDLNIMSEPELIDYMEECCTFI